MLRSFVLKASLLVMVVSLCVGVPTVNAEVVGPLNWTSPTYQDLNDVFMVSASDGWAVGDYGAIYQWTGAEWIPEIPPAMLMSLLIGLTIVTVILAKTASKKHRKPSLPSKTQL